MTKFVVLGGGIAGISACYHAKKDGFDVKCYEATSTPGGLVSNFTINGFRFDNAIHMSFTNDSYVRSIFDKTDYYSHKPNPYCLDRKMWLKHPIQNNLFNLPLEEKVTHIESFLERPALEPSNYAEWLDHQYGTSISNKYPKSYTVKYWGLNANELSLSWIGSRVRRAEFKEILSGALELQDENHYYANEMRYPKQGGYFSFIRAIANECHIVCNKKAIEIDIDAKTIHFEDGSKTFYSKLISTLPLPTICSLINNCPVNVKEAADSLLWTTVDLISIGFDRDDVPPYLWFYIYDEDNLAARAYSPSLKSPDNVPKGKSSLQFEVYNLSTNMRLNAEDLKKNIKDKLLEMGICKEYEIEFVHHKHLPFGNVIFDHGMEDRRKIVLDYLKLVGILTCGRFGEWDYLWSDQSLLSGKMSIEKLKNNQR